MTAKQLKVFWPKVNKHSGIFNIVDGKRSECWVWMGGRSSGYGSFYPHGLTHRIMWGLKYGYIPTGMLICHKCDNTICIRPTHLFVGTQKDNMADMHKKGRANLAFGDRNGSRTHPERLVRGANNTMHSHPEIASRGEKHSVIMRKVAARGESNGNVKLTSNDVNEIRQLHSQYIITHSALAIRFSVSRSQIQRILYCKSRVKG